MFRKSQIIARRSLTQPANIEDTIPQLFPREAPFERHDERMHKVAVTRFGVGQPASLHGDRQMESNISG